MTELAAHPDGCTAMPNVQINRRRLRRYGTSNSAVSASGELSDWVNRQERSDYPAETQGGDRERTRPTTPRRPCAGQRQRTTGTTGRRAAASTAGEISRRAPREAVLSPAGEGDTLARSNKPMGAPSTALNLRRQSELTHSFASIALIRLHAAERHQPKQEHRPSTRLRRVSRTAAAPTERRALRDLLAQLLGCSTCKHYRMPTERAYVTWMCGFILFHSKRHPPEVAARGRVS